MRTALLLITLISMQFVTAQENEKGNFFNDHFNDKLTFQLYPNPFTGGKLHIISNPNEI